jgi:NAD(P)-dependent dehydrogenase (short-subunit alcohol dehydrogenase family)
MTRPLEGKVALVTGAARGIGRELALELGGLGATVVVTARTDTPREGLVGTIGETAAAVEAVGSDALAVRTDLLDAADVANLVDTVMEKFGGVDILVNNAADTGDNVFRGFWATSPDDWQAQVQLNLNVVFNLMKAFAPVMKERGAGFIANIGSLRDVVEMGEGLMPEPDGPGVRLGAAYPATKVAVYTMTTLMGRELAGDGIVAFTLQPGATLSETFVRNAERFGYDPSYGAPLDTSAKVLAAIVTSADPMQYAGQYIDAVSFMTAHTS